MLHHRFYATTVHADMRIPSLPKEESDNEYLNNRLAAFSFQSTREMHGGRYVQIPIEGSADPCKHPYFET